MSLPPPKHSLSQKSDKRTPALPTPSCSTSASEVTAQLRRELEQEIAEKEKQLQDSNSGIGKSVVLARQISQLKDKLNDMDRQQQQLQQQLQQQQQADRKQNAFPSRQSPVMASEDGLPPATLEKLRTLERDLNLHRGNQQPLSPSLSGHRKDKLLGQRSTGLDPLPSPSTSTIQPPVHGHDSTSLLPLPPPASGSTPTKRRSKVPNADRRNTDIEFATEIGQGLLVEVRKQQALVREKEDQLAALQAQKADLERAAESLTKQLRQKEENEERLKEETWNLELARQELSMTVTELQQNLNKANAEQAKLARQVADLTNEVEHMRDREERLVATIEGLKSRHEADMSTLRRNYTEQQRQKMDYMKQVETLSSEVAILKSQSRIAKRSNSELKVAAAAETAEVLAPDTAGANREGSTPGTTPPPSPKQTPSRNQALEVETLKTSLAHAHRMVSNLRSNLHKEKTEKFELKKLLAESQEAIEQYQNDPRLWVDAGHTGKTGAGAGMFDANGSGGHRKTRKGKRRAPVSKTRVGRPTRGGESLDDMSDVENHPRRKESRVSAYSSLDDSDDAEDAEEEAVHGAAFDLSSSSSSPTKRVRGERGASAAIAKENADGPRTLSDELNAVSGDRGKGAAIPTPTITVLAGIDMATQTEQNDQPEHPVTQQTLVEQHMVAADVPPVEFKEQATQCSPPPAVDVDIQTTQPTMVEKSIQTPVATAVDSGVQYEPAERIDQGIQFSPVALGVDQSVQYEPVDVKDTGVQSDPAPVPETMEIGTQSDDIAAPMPVFTEAGVQSESPQTRDAETQHDPVPAGKDAASQSEFEMPAPATPVVVPTVDVGVQTSPSETLSVPGAVAAGAAAVLGLGALAKATDVSPETHQPSVASGPKQNEDADEYAKLPTTSTAAVAGHEEKHDHSADPGASRRVLNDNVPDDGNQEQAHDSKRVSMADSALATSTAPLASTSTPSEPAPSDDASQDAKVYSKAEADAMVAAAVAAALANADSSRRSILNEKRPVNSIALSDTNRDIPPRPTSPPPQRLLSRISQSPLAVNADPLQKRASMGSSVMDKDKLSAAARSLDARVLPNGPPSELNDEASDRRQDGRTLSSLSSLSVSDARASVVSSPMDLAVREGDASQIALLTQTMIGNWLWKYTRKPMGGGLSEYRHKRFFWVHPYTRTLYWSVQSPDSSGKEIKAKSARIEGVSVVPDYVQDPPGLPNVSLVIKTTHRLLKLTAPSMAHHNVWFESLSYLLSRVTADTSFLDPRRTVDSRTISESLSNEPTSLLRKPSAHKLHGLFRNGPKTEPTGRTSGESQPLSERDHRDGNRPDHRMDDDDQDEALEDVRMCCDGKHHVSKLERAHIHDRPYYRKRQSRQALRATATAPK